MLQLRANVLAAREHMSRGLEELKRRHQAGHSGISVSALAADVRDEVLLELYSAATGDQTAVVGGDRLA